MELSFISKHYMLLQLYKMYFAKNEVTFK